MSQLESLTNFFTDNMPPRVMQSFSSEMESLKTIPAAKDYGLGQYRQSVIRYDAVLIWERWPYRDFDPRVLMSLLEAWLAAANRDLLAQVGITNADPDWDIVVIGEETATVAVTIPLADELVIVEDENGIIPFDGRHWRLADPVIWTALTAQVFAADNTGAPV